MDRGQAHIQRQQRGRSFCKRGRQQRCHRFAVADRLHQDGPGGRGRVGRDCGWSQADKLASIDGMRAEVKRLRAIWVAAGGGDAGGG